MKTRLALELLMAHDGNIVEIEITFECPNGHAIRINFTHIQRKGSLREIEEQTFDLTCWECGWKGSKLGVERTELRPISRDDLKKMAKSVEGSKNRAISK